MDPELKTWVEANTTFPNTMVDRITPVTEAEHIELVARWVILNAFGSIVFIHQFFTFISNRDDIPKSSTLTS